MNYKMLAFEIAVLFGGVSLSFIEEVNLLLRTFGLIISITVGVLTTIKLIRDLKKKRNVRKT